MRFNVPVDTFPYMAYTLSSAVRHKIKPVLAQHKYSSNWLSVIEYLGVESDVEVSNFIKSKLTKSQNQHLI